MHQDGGSSNFPQIFSAFSAWPRHNLLRVLVSWVGSARFGRSKRGRGRRMQMGYPSGTSVVVVLAYFPSELTSTPIHALIRRLRLLGAARDMMSSLTPRCGIRRSHEPVHTAFLDKTTPTWVVLTKIAIDVP